MANLNLAWCFTNRCVGLALDVGWNLLRFDLADRAPGLLLVTARTVGAEIAVVNILVTASATQGVIRRDGPPIVVATQTLSVRVRSQEGNTGLFLVIVAEVAHQRVPPVAHVTRHTIRGKRVMWKHRPEFCPPAMAGVPTP